MSLGSFALYVVAVLLLRQDVAYGWRIEAGSAIPVAISHLVYGTPLGAVDWNMLMRFSNLQGATVQDVMGLAVSGGIPRGETLMYAIDGNGVGINLFTTFAMWAFGIKLSSIIIFYLLFVGLSAAAFTGRFQDRRLVVVPLYFLVVTVMLLTPLSASHQGVDQNAIGGVRYFVLAAFLPAFHIWFELIDRKNEPRRSLLVRNRLLLLLQALLFVGAFLARTATGYVIGAFLLAAIYRLYRARRHGDGLRTLAVAGGTLGIAVAVWAAFIIVATPAYVQSGRVFTVFWHRAFISFSNSPDWPFGDLQSVYHCPPAELSRTDADENGGCVWWADSAKAKRSQMDIAKGTYGGEYEKVLRHAYFYVVTHYPRQVLDLYVNVKSQLLKRTLIDALDFLKQLPQSPMWQTLFLIVAAQVILLVLSFLLSGFGAAGLLDPGLIIFPLLLVLSIVPRYVAWPSWMTGADMILLLYCCIALSPFLLFEVIFRGLRRRPRPLPSPASCGREPAFDG
jgi:hypothetical protein